MQRVAPRILDRVGQFHWDATSYLDLMHSEVAGYERLQDESAEATRPIEARRILELGTGTGETARRLLAVHPLADLIGVDSSEQMLAVARRLLDRDGVDLRLARIEDSLPEGPLISSCPLSSCTTWRRRTRPSFSGGFTRCSVRPDASSWRMWWCPSEPRTRPRRSAPTTITQAR